MSIILIRHGETALNAARVLQPAATPLNEKGIEQAQAMAGRLGNTGIEAILSSDMPRAFMTAQALSKTTGLPIATSTLLHERSFGDLRGLPYDDLDFDPNAQDYEPPNGESWPVFLARVARAFEEIVRTRATMQGTLAVVTHGLVIRAILESHVQLPAGSAAPERMGNTSVSIFGSSAPHPVSLMNCSAHLEGRISDDARALAGF
jgi:broad specificity phosphatase PhoE